MLPAMALPFMWVCWQTFKRIEYEEKYHLSDNNPFTDGL